jgi:AcrR family transcriptional regulator
VADDPRDALLSVAREIIEKRGYIGLSMRTAAAAAGVTPEVARRYYRDRDALFAAALRLPVDPTTAIPTLVAPGLEGMGERLVRFTFDILKDPEARSELVSLARTGVNAGHAAAGLQDFLEKGVVDRVASMIGVPDARMRSALITSYLLGIAMTRYAVRLEPLSSASEEEVIRMVAPVIQDLLDPRKPLPGSARGRGNAQRPKSSDGSTTRSKPASSTPSVPTRTFQADPRAWAEQQSTSSTSVKAAGSAPASGARTAGAPAAPGTARPAARGHAQQEATAPKPGGTAPAGRKTVAEPPGTASTKARDAATPTARDAATPTPKHAAKAPEAKPATRDATRARTAGAPKATGATAPRPPSTRAAGRSTAPRSPAPGPTPDAPDGSS